MASSAECSQAAPQVLLVDTQSLPVLLQGDGEEDSNDISVDLLQQALQGATSIDNCQATSEVNLGALCSNNSDFVAIFQGDEGKTHTIKMSLAEAESLGLHFTSESFPVTNALEEMKEDTEVNNLVDGASDTSHVLSIQHSNFMSTVPCSNMVTEGRIIDEEGNIVQATDAIQVLPTSALSSLLEGEINHSITIVPQYGLDGTIVNYAVKLKDDEEEDIGSDYRLLEPVSSAKAEINIDEELSAENIKENLLHTPLSIRVPTTVSISIPNSTTASTTLSLPLTSFEPTSSQEPTAVSVALTSASLNKLEVPSTLTLSHPSPQNRFFRIMQDDNSEIINNTSGSNSLADITSIISTSLNQKTTVLANKHLLQPTSQLTTKMLNMNGAVLGLGTLPGNQSSIVASANLSKSIGSKNRSYGIANKSTSLLTTSSRNFPISTTKVMPVSVATPVSSVVGPVPAPAMAAVAPTTLQPTIGGAAINKTSIISRGSTTSTNSSKPLGSSENPIQLVQQGQTFHLQNSMQALNQAQLRQIATVLQQKNLSANHAASKNVLIDEQTKTRIVYRVVYPEDVDLQQPNSPTEQKDTSSSSSCTPAKAKKRRGRPSKAATGKDTEETNADRPKKRHLQNGVSETRKTPEQEEDKISEDAPLKEIKKVIGSRTRSGRVSRPPKHMMTDFKRLLPRDYKEPEIDDSDGGFSDYSVSNELLSTKPEEKPPKYEYVVKEYTPAQRRISRYGCPTCSKIYLGHARMERHFKQFPDHGSIEEFKTSMPTPPPPEPAKEKEKKLAKSRIGETNHQIPKGKRRGQWAYRSAGERSEYRKKKLRQALEICEVPEIVEVVGPLVARYCSLWELLLLRLDAKNKSQPTTASDQKNNKLDSNDSSLMLLDEKNLTSEESVRESSISEDRQTQRGNSNRVQWLLMELGSLIDTLQSVAMDMLQPTNLHNNADYMVEIGKKAISDLLGVSCGTYLANDQMLQERIEVLMTGYKRLFEDNVEEDAAKRMKTHEIVSELDGTSVTVEDNAACPEVLSTLSLMAKPTVGCVNENNMKLSDMPFLNSSDDMICDGDHDLSTDSKRDQDCDSATGLQVVDEIVKERLKNLGENINFSVPLPTNLTSGINEQQNLHLIGGFDDSNSSISVSNSSVITNTLVDDKSSVTVSNMDLIGTYSMSSLTSSGPIVQNGAISNPVPASDLSSSLEPVTSQGILSSFPIGLPSLTTFDSLQTETSTVSHSTDSFLDSLGSFETPLSQPCDPTDEPVPSYADSVIKNNSILQLEPGTSEANRPPPKFIASFTPADTNDKPATPITTAQRLQRSYLDLDVGIDTDLDFEALTEEFGNSAPN